MKPFPCTAVCFHVTIIIKAINLQFFPCSQCLWRSWKSYRVCSVVAKVYHLVRRKKQIHTYTINIRHLMPCQCICKGIKVWAWMHRPPHTLPNWRNEGLTYKHSHRRHSIPPSRQVLFYYMPKSQQTKPVDHLTPFRLAPPPLQSNSLSFRHLYPAFRWFTRALFHIRAKSSQFTQGYGWHFLSGAHI